MRYQTEIEIGGRLISAEAPTYFIADIASNHDGDIERAKDLIHLARDAGAEAAKFQHFQAGTIVSDYGFKSLGEQAGHQAQWRKSVFEVYEDASLNLDWTPTLKETCDNAGIAFLTSPYSKELVEQVDAYVPAYKIGSGDITWLEILEHISAKGKPVLLATGASDLVDVVRAVEVVARSNSRIVLMQCNTNYTGSVESFSYVNLNVFRTFQGLYPGLVLGLSDHTPGPAAALGAVALGARVIEKHLTDDNNREGPDHKFAMNPLTFRDMVDRTRELEAALGDGVKRVEQNENVTVVLQRRCLRLTRDLRPGWVLTAKDIQALRPAPEGAVQPYDLAAVLGKALRSAKVAGDAIYPEDLLEGKC